MIVWRNCGRVEVDGVRMANEVEKRLGHTKTPLNVSVLGCVVNGIGEGKEADIGIAGGQGGGILFKKGKLVRKVRSEELMDTLIEEVERMAEEQGEADSRQENRDALPTSLGTSSPALPTVNRDLPVLPNR